MATLAVAPFIDAENSQFLRPMVKFRMARSQMLLNMAALPSFSYTLRPSLWLYVPAAILPTFYLPGVYQLFRVSDFRHLSHMRGTT